MALTLGIDLPLIVPRGATKSAQPRTPSIARAIWKGVLRIGDLSVPVKLYSTVQEHSVHFRLLHDQDMVPIKERMVHPDTEKEVPYEKHRKGVEIEPGLFVLVTDEDLEHVAPPESRDIHVEQFVPQTEVSHQWFVRPYYLGPDGDDDDDYFALADALAASGREGIARWTMRKKPYVGALRSDGGYLLLVTMRHEGEVIDPQQLEPPEGRALDDREVKMGHQLVEALHAPFKADKVEDKYRERVLELVESKAKGKKLKPEPASAPAKTVKTLADMLKLSLSSTKGGKRG